MSGMYMSEWPMFGTKDPNLGSSTDLLFDRDFIFGAFATCLIQGGYPVGATFERTGDVVTTGGTFGPNEPITLGGKYYHHGQITETVPAYDISPIVRPTAPDVYDTCGAQPNPDKKGLNWEFSDPKNAWAWDLLDGRADGVDLVTGGDFSNPSDWTLGPGWSISGGVANASGTVAYSRLSQSLSTVIGGRYEICIEVLDSNLVEYCYIRKPRDASIPDTYFKFSSIGSYCYRMTVGSENDELAIANAETGSNMDFDNLSLKQISPATGTLNLKGLSVVPSVTEWQTVGDFNILSGATGNQILYIESGTGLICATDGTNTTKSVQPYVAGQDHTVSLAFGDSKMQIYVDGVNGTQVPFVGTFTPGETLKWGLNNEDIFSKGNVCGQTTSSFSESVHLAEELAYDL